MGIVREILDRIEAEYEQIAKGRHGSGDKDRDLGSDYFARRPKSGAG